MENQPLHVIDAPTPIKVAIIGGLGQMGRWFHRFFERRGLEVLIADKETPLTSKDAAAQADVVFLSVPIHQVSKVVAEVAPHLRPEAALMDFTSVKQEPLAAMLAHFPGEVVGTHPLFGPVEKGIAGRTVVICPGRGDKWLHWLQDLLLEAGARVELTSAEEHDRLMSLVQGLAHFMLMALAGSIARMDIDPKKLELFATPTFGTMFHLTRHLLSQDAALYACIQLQNQANLQALSAFEEVVRELLTLVQTRDAPGLVRLLEGIKKGFFGKGGPRA